MSNAAGAKPFPWGDVVQEAVRRWSTPFYVFAWTPIREAFEELRPLSQLGVAIRHWYSVKTQPVKPLMLRWKEEFGCGAEVVSLFELVAAKQSGFTADNILVNGLAKHAWLPEGMPGLRVHLNSLREVESLGVERLRSYRLGVRCHLASGHQPKDPAIGGQFGMTGAEVSKTVEFLRRHGLQLEGVHFHLRSNIRDPMIYVSAMEESLAMAAAAGFTPHYVDCGGGLGVPGEATWEHRKRETGALSISKLVGYLQLVLQRHPSVTEVWFENGRFITSRGGVLVLKVLDIKDRPEIRYLLCDGGRTNHALPADWQDNALTTLPARSGPEVLTGVYGATCTAYDRFRPRLMPQTVSVGDYIIWFNAGAYHLSWETRFSQGLAKVIWCDERMRLSLARAGEDPQAWWGTWA